MTAEEIYAIEPDKFGCRTLPNGNRVQLGHLVRFGTNVLFGNGVVIGDFAQLGSNVCLGDHTRVGVCARVESDVQTDKFVQIGCDAYLDFGVRLGRNTRVGNGVCLDTGVQLGAGVCLNANTQLGPNVQLGDHDSPLQLQGPEYIVYPFSRGTIGVGCHIRSWSQWLRNGDKYADRRAVDAKKYEPLIVFLREWMQKHKAFCES